MTRVVSTKVKSTVLAHQALAKSHPEPLTVKQVAERCGMAQRVAERVVAAVVAAGAAVRVRRLDGLQGYAYTVAP
jgi:hypothetical protein